MRQAGQFFEISYLLLKFLQEGRKGKRVVGNNNKQKNNLYSTQYVVLNIIRMLTH